VINAVKRFSGSGGESLGVGKADKKGGSQAWATGGGEGVDFFERQMGVFERLLNEGSDAESVIAASDFGNDTTVVPMDLDLGRD
tara:strand:- start:732 stop:983 length:252 start_codon:yes stop_codon:yes gene_type:complete